MSELTRCNHCVYEDMKRRAAKRGATVILRADGDWVSARYSDETAPRHFFRELSDGCVC